MTAGAMQIFHEQKIADINSRINAHQSFMKTATPGSFLNLIATGDSWFDYPLDGDFPGINTDVLAQLKKIAARRPEILSLAHYGYTSTQEMGLARQSMLIDQLQNPMNGKFDAILMSAGGNDIAGDALVIWLNDHRTVAGDWAHAINLPRYNEALDVIEASFLDVISIRDEFAPGTPIFVHSYDYPIVNGKGVCTLGPWLKPAFDFCGWTDEKQCNAVISRMMILFAAMLDRLASISSNNFKHVRTLGTIAATDWTNELHPNEAGFTKIAGKFRDALEAQFPGCV